MTVGVKVVGGSVDRARGVDDVLAVLVVIVVAVEALPAPVGVGAGGQLEPAVPVVPAAGADLLIADAVVAAARVDLPAVLDVYADMVGTRETESVYSGDAVADVAPVSAVRLRVGEHVKTVASAVGPDQSRAVDRSGLCSAPNVAPFFVVCVQRVLCKSRAGALSARGHARAEHAYARKDDDAHRCGGKPFYPVHLDNTSVSTSRKHQPIPRKHFRKITNADSLLTNL